MQRKVRLVMCSNSINHAENISRGMWSHKDARSRLALISGPLNPVIHSLEYNIVGHLRYDIFLLE